MLCPWPATLPPVNVKEVWVVVSLSRAALAADAAAHRQEKCGLDEESASVQVF